MPSVRSPARTLVSGIAFCDLVCLICSEIQDVYIKYLVYPGDIGDHVSCRRPGRSIEIVSSKAFPPDVGTLCVHDVDLRGSSPV